ncbi:hypothetical protein JNJ66_00860 [Candidatus Saccharibacteria bacterium]|nr:hypothetical protein [Candidatus Saccharibacteria bacterium]
MPISFPFDDLRATPQFKKPQPVYAVRLKALSSGTVYEVGTSQRNDRHTAQGITAVLLNQEGHVGTSVPWMEWIANYQRVPVPGWPDIVWVDTRLPRGYLLDEPLAVRENGSPTQLPAATLVLSHNGVLSYVLPQQAAVDYLSPQKVRCAGMTAWTQPHYAHWCVTEVQRMLALADPTQLQPQEEGSNA